VKHLVVFDEYFGGEVSLFDDIVKFCNSNADTFIRNDIDIFLSVVKKFFKPPFVYNELTAKVVNSFMPSSKLGKYSFESDTIDVEVNGVVYNINIYMMIIKCFAEKNLDNIQVKFNNFVMYTDKKTGNKYNKYIDNTFCFGNSRHIVILADLVDAINDYMTCFEDKLNSKV